MSEFQATNIRFADENYYLIQSGSRHSLYFREEKKCLIQYINTTKNHLSQKGDLKVYIATSDTDENLMIKSTLNPIADHYQQLEANNADTFTIQNDNFY